MNLEASHTIEVGGSTDEGDADVCLACRRCTWIEWLSVSTEECGPGPTLGGIIERAEGHIEQAHGGDLL